MGDLNGIGVLQQTHEDNQIQVMIISPKPEWKIKEYHVNNKKSESDVFVPISTPKYKRSEANCSGQLLKPLSFGFPKSVAVWLDNKNITNGYISIPTH